MRTDFTYCSGVSIVDFAQVNVRWQVGSISQTCQILLIRNKRYPLKCVQNTFVSVKLLVNRNHYREINQGLLPMHLHVNILSNVSFRTLINRFQVQTR